MSDLSQARQRAARLYPRNKNLRNTYVRGASAAMHGKTADACPYKRDPRKTWAAGYRKAWLLGYQSIA